MRGLGRIAGLRRAFLPALLPDDFEARLDYADAYPLRSLGSEWAPFNAASISLGDGSLLGVPLPGHSACQLGLAVRRSDGQRCFRRPMRAGRHAHSANAGCPSSRGR